MCVWGGGGGLGGVFVGEGGACVHMRVYGYSGGKVTERYVMH